mmetsp:Transcript_3997/g.11342  ORF Transcript_3997/g.11342 Transcript_3997/m.11342 type:complete len:202 (+) Transcript_3997:775-1380(+)
MVVVRRRDAAHGNQNFAEIKFHGARFTRKIVRTGAAVRDFLEARSQIFYILVAAFFVCSFVLDYFMDGRCVIPKLLLVDLPYKVIEGIIKGTQPDTEHEQEVFEAGVGVGVGVGAATTAVTAARLMSQSRSARAATSGLSVSESLALWDHLATVIQQFARGAAARRLVAVARAEAKASAPSSPVRVERSVAVVSPTPSMAV